MDAHTTTVDKIDSPTQNRRHRWTADALPCGTITAHRNVAVPCGWQLLLIGKHAESSPQPKVTTGHSAEVKCVASLASSVSARWGAMYLLAQAPSTTLRVRQLEALLRLCDTLISRAPGRLRKRWRTPYNLRHRSRLALTTYSGRPPKNKRGAPC